MYRGLEQGLKHLVAKYGEERVFIGPANVQATQQYFSWPELVTVCDLASAQTAVDTIVAQGEGARGEWQKGHYGQFFNIAKEYTELKRQHPDFVAQHGWFYTNGC